MSQFGLMQDDTITFPFTQIYFMFISIKKNKLSLNYSNCNKIWFKSYALLMVCYKNLKKNK